MADKFFLRKQTAKLQSQLPTIVVMYKGVCSTLLQTQTLPTEFAMQKTRTTQT